MNKEQLHIFLEEKEFPTSFDLDSLKEMIERFPYFEAARFLYLKALYQYDMIAFRSELANMSVLLSNREALFYYIFKEEYAQYFRQSGRKNFVEDKTDILLNAFFESTETSDLSFDYEVSTQNLATTDYLSFLEEEKNKGAKEEKRKTAQQKTLSGLIYIEDKKEEDNFDQKTDTHPHTEELITIDKKEESTNTPTFSSEIHIEYPLEEYVIDEEEEDVEVLPMKHQSIIDKFLEKSSKKDFAITLDKKGLENDKDYPIEEEDSKSSSELDEDMFFTETLARIYTKQGRFEKAHEIIEHLSLKYPRKNSYFADQLSYLEKLIINSKHTKKK